MQTTSIVRLIATISVVYFTCACHQVPQLAPRLISPEDNVGDDFWLAAPYVAVVKITSTDLQGPRQPVFQGGPKVLQLVRFQANVEDVIKGDLPNKAIAFFFFAKADQKPYYFLDRGRRYIVSLRSEGGVLRSWADATQLAIWVHSGSHDQKEPPLEAGPSTTIAYILLTPGANCDLKEFENTLRLPRYGDPGYVNDRLKRLELSADRELSDAACLTAATIFWHRPNLSAWNKLCGAPTAGRAEQQRA